MGLAPLRIKHPAMQGGITYAQAMELTPVQVFAINVAQ